MKKLTVDYSDERPISPEAFAGVLRRSTLGERRPVDDAECIRRMVEEADVTVTAWVDEELVGVARSVTDFAYCCYLSDLAVDRTVQRLGIGRELIRRTRRLLGPRCKLILLSAPAATGYYPRLGFEQHPSAWVLHEEREIEG